MYRFETKIRSKTKLIIFLTMCLIPIQILNALPADSILIKPQNENAGKKSVYEISFSLDFAISKDASFIITFPGEFDLSGVLVAGSSTMNGGFKLSVDKNKVIIKRSGLGKIINPNESVDLRFANVKNPQTPADNYTIKIEVKNNDDKVSVAKENRVKIIAAK